MRMFFVSLALLAGMFIHPIQASAQQVDCTTYVDNPACIKHRQRPGTPVPYSDLVCFRIRQNQPGIVTLNIYDENGVQINASDVQHSEWKEADDTFCIGRHWVREGYLFEWCNDYFGRVWERSAIVRYSGTSAVVMLVHQRGNLPRRPDSLPQVLRTR